MALWTGTGHSTLAIKMLIIITYINKNIIKWSIILWTISFKFDEQNKFIPSSVVLKFALIYKN